MSGTRIPLRIATMAVAIAAVFAMSTGVALADDLVVKGDYTVRSGRTVDDNIKIYNGTLTVKGTVDGNVEQYGPGSVVVSSRGHVDGNIEETGRRPRRGPRRSRWQHRRTRSRSGDRRPLRRRRRQRR